jgi:predicted metal-binding protein
MKTKHQILVCSTCASVWKDGHRIGISGGQKLFEELKQNFENWAHSSEYELNSVECMSACSNSCVIAFNSPGKYTYVFGDLPTENAADSVFECASKYYQQAQGMLAWKDRPELLKKGIIARVPPV